MDEREFWVVINNSVGSNLKGYSNEFLWHLARVGNDDALVLLYNNLKGCWMNKVPYDNNMYSMNDWEQVAALEFFRVWKKYDPSKKIKFVTFIYTCIRNCWINILNSFSRKVCATSESSFEDFSNLLTTEFIDYGMSEDEYVNEFREYLKQNELDDVVLVYDLKLKNKTIADIANTLGITTKHVSECFSKIRDYVSFYCLRKESFNV